MDDLKTKPKGLCFTRNHELQDREVFLALDVCKDLPAELVIEQANVIMCTTAEDILEKSSCLDTHEYLLRFEYNKDSNPPTFTHIVSDKRRMRAKAHIQEYRLPSTAFYSMAVYTLYLPSFLKI